MTADKKKILIYVSFFYKITYNDFMLLIYSFHTDPSGTFMAYTAKAIGSGSEGAQNELEKKYHRVNEFAFCITIYHLYILF